MSIIKPVTDERKDIFLYKTRVENLFINEFLPEAPGDYVKVYLFGLMYAQYDQVMDSAKLSMILGLSEDEIEEAWIYWESKGLVRFKTDIGSNGENDRKLVFTRQIEVLYGKASAEPVDESPEAKDSDAAGGSPDASSGSGRQKAGGGRICPGLSDHGAGHRPNGSSAGGPGAAA
jgi:hypothetical protein